jgi:putative solute:sodium symporter small subunit
VRRVKRRIPASLRWGGPALREDDALMQNSNDQTHWRRTTRLMLVHLGVWIFFGYIIHMFVNTLNQWTIPILKFPLGFYMAAQGSLIVFVVMLFVFAWQQDRIDRQHGVAEDD